MQLLKTNEFPEMGVSHNPEIKKRVFIGNGRIPHLTNFSTATFKPGQSVEFHAHETMTEVFYVTNGDAIFLFKDKELPVTVGDCIIVDPGEMHAMRNAGLADVSWFYFGIAI